MSVRAGMRTRNRDLSASLRVGLALGLSIGLAVAAPAASAQTDASAPGETQVIRKIERGGFAQLEAGPAFFLAPDASADYGLGLEAGVHFGFDVLPILNLSLGLGATAVGGSEEVSGQVLLRDRFYLTPSLRAQLALLTTDRHFLWIRAEGGLAILMMQQEEAQLGPSFGGAVGYEYFTTLRHFSIGAQLGAQTYLEPDLALAIYLMPTLKYSF